MAVDHEQVGEEQHSTHGRPQVNGKHVTPGQLVPDRQERNLLHAGQVHLPYEQDAIVVEAVRHLREVYADKPDPGRFLPEEFTVYLLRHVHEPVLGHDLDKDVSRRQMLPYLEPTGRMSERTVGRPARPFRRIG